MLAVYINYPNPLISVHQDTACANIGKMSKPGQRKLRLDVGTLSTELLKFQHKEYRFAADATLNDMWLEIDFGDRRFEEEVLRYVQMLIGSHYRPLKGVEPQVHCVELGRT